MLSSSFRDPVDALAHRFKSGTVRIDSGQKVNSGEIETLTTFGRPQGTIKRMTYGSRAALTDSRPPGNASPERAFSELTWPPRVRIFARTTHTCTRLSGALPVLRELPADAFTYHLTVPRPRPFSTVTDDVRELATGGNWSMCLPFQ
jgi:hypothetical protein